MASYQKYGRATRKKQENFGYHPQVSGDHSAWYPTGGSEDIFFVLSNISPFPVFQFKFHQYRVTVFFQIRKRRLRTFFKEFESIYQHIEINVFAKERAYVHRYTEINGRTIFIYIILEQFGIGFGFSISRTKTVSAFFFTLKIGIQ